jgi:hypothetical protein
MVIVWIADAGSGTVNTASAPSIFTFFELLTFAPSFHMAFIELLLDFRRRHCRTTIAILARRVLPLHYSRSSAFLEREPHARRNGWTRITPEFCADCRASIL